MRYIEGVGYVDETAYYNSIREKKGDNGKFDNLFEAETAVYATPDPNPKVTAAKQYRTVTAPEELNEYFANAAKETGVDVNLLKAVAKAESDFDPDCTSSSGAMGIMQLMPATARGLGVHNAYDPKENILGGAKYLRKMLDRFNGDVSLALAAYNAGPNNVDKYKGIPPFKETEEYVKRVLGYAGRDIEITGNVYTYYGTDGTGSTAGTRYDNAAGNTDNNNNTSDTAVITARPTAPPTDNNTITTIYSVAAQDATANIKKPL